jgi:hypothetical protein
VAAAVGMTLHRAWHWMRTGSGTNGTWHYDWAMLEMATVCTPTPVGIPEGQLQQLILCVRPYCDGGGEVAVVAAESWLGGDLGDG